MNVINLTREMLVGFLDTKEKLSKKQMIEINNEYKRLCNTASDEDKKDYEKWYESDEYYPPFVAEAISNVI